MISNIILSIQGCSSYGVLKEAIEHIFTSAAKINVVVSNDDNEFFLQFEQNHWNEMFLCVEYAS